MSDLSAQALEELRQIRALLGRQVAMQAWFMGLQSDPFSPALVCPEQAAAEARSAALARQSVDPAVPSVGDVPAPGCSQSALSPRGYSECSA